MYGGVDDRGVRLGRKEEIKVGKSDVDDPSERPN